MVSSYAEISHFKVSKDYKSGATSPPLALIGQINGLKNFYVGYQTEDPNVLFWVNDWATKEDRTAFSKRADYADIEKASRPAFGSEPTFHYVEFENTDGPLGAPITEFVTFSLKEGNTLAELEPLVQELHQKLPGTPRFHGDSWALIENRRDAYMGILGWDTVEAHWDAVSGGPLKEVIDRVKKIADLWIRNENQLRGMHALEERTGRGVLSTL